MRCRKIILILFFWGCFQSNNALAKLGFSLNLKSWKLPALQEQAEAGNTEAQFDLGRVYWYGDRRINVKQDYYKAVIWFEEAAKKDESRAQDYLGLAYSSGAGGKQVDLKHAFDWFEKSALQNNLCAQIHLAQAYAKGAGVTKDCRRAADWINQVVSSPSWENMGWLDCDERFATLQKIDKEGLECTD